MMMRTKRFALATLALALGALGGCAYDFDSICREGEVCDPDSIPLPRTGEPGIPHVAACRMLLGTCVGTAAPTACHFVITGGNVDSEPVCIAAPGSAGRDRVCSDAMGCAIGLTCVRPAAGANGVCRDLCTTAGDCTRSTRDNEGVTCDRSRRIATIGEVGIYACAPVAD